MQLVPLVNIIWSNNDIYSDSHLDLGFAWTYDHYYYGEGKIVGVVHVIDSIVKGLQDNPNRKYIYIRISSAIPRLIV